MQLPTGTRFGIYEIHSALGAGGMGEVYRARDTRLGRDVAIKVLPAPFAADADRLARFEREARLLASLNHPGIGAIYGLEYASFASGEPPVPGLILELVDGDTLADRIRRGPIPLADALVIAQQAVEALDFAHERGIVHRDLKPANIKLTEDGVVKILDFGLAKALAGQGDGAAKDPASSPTVTSDDTRAGIILGTAAYMSPEQARGKPLDKRTDVWAFGCVFYEMLTGTRTFDGESVSDAIAAILGRDPEWSRLPAATPPRVRGLLRRCLEKDARRRLRDIADARPDLDEAIANPGLRDQPAASAARRPRWLSWQSLVVVGAGLVTSVAAGWMVARSREPVAVPIFDRMIRLVSTSAHEFAPAISPDGKWVAYLSNARGPTDVWVKFIAGGDAVNLTASSDLTVQAQDYIGGLAVSPDGASIAFQAQAPEQRPGVWVIPAPLGGAPRRLLPPGMGNMQWSPDGRRIAYVKTGGSLGDALMIADADGQNEVEIVKRQGARHLHWVRWDRSAAFLYFNRSFQNFNTEPTEIFRVPVRGGPIEPVVSTARRAAYPCPSPIEPGLFYAANPDGVDLGLWWRDLSTGRDYRVTTGIGEYSSPSISGDGRRLVGTVLEVRQSLERLPVTFDQPARPETLTDGFLGDSDPAWSPNGSRLVFSSARTGNRTLWIAAGDRDFAHASPLTTGVALDERPVFSPDGQQIAFVSDRGGKRGIWSVSADAGALRQIATADVVDTLSWSADGRRLVFSTPTGDAPGLTTVDAASGAMTRVPTPAAAAAPAWSPRADVIAYVEPRGGTIGSPVRFVTSTGQPLYEQLLGYGQGPILPGKPQVANGMLAWSPDGRQLAAASLPGGTSGAVWIIEPEGRIPYRKLLDLPPGVFLRGLSWSRDGSSLIVGRIQWTGDIFLAERPTRP